MNCTSLRSLFACALALSFTATGCNREPQPNETETNGTSTGDGTMGQTQSTLPTTSLPEPDSTTADETTAGVDASTGPGTTADTSVTTGAPACADPEGQPNDSECTDKSGCGCESGKCFVVPALGGFCGECIADADCDGGGCTVPNPIDGIGATCNTGQPGEGCMSDAVCADPANALCGTLLNVPGILNVSTCGQCKANADCADPALPNCTPTYDVDNFKGKLDCVADASVENNFGCSLEDDGGVPAGNKACVSGFCGEASVMGLLKLGICGECNSDADCGNGTCTDPSVDLNSGMLVGSVCQ